jgi:hypothetical protein
MLDQSGLQAGLERLRGQLEKNILERAEDESSIREDLQHRYDFAKAAKRTGLAFELWRENEITQAAVAWLLGCVFVRFLEDNLLINQPWISGPGERLARAKEHNVQTYRDGLQKGDRDYLLLCFDEMSRLPGGAGLFDKEHNPLYRLSPTGHGARAIIDFFQRPGDDGSLLFDFTGTIDNTRFLGDLYQNISESARKRYALVQTPDFVVDFILDRTMTPALEEFGLEGFRIIDPACGSGHFLLAAFDRLFHRWQQHAPDLGPVEHANRALASIYGVDLNPFAVAIAHFRLLIAALRGCEVMRLRDNFDFKINLAVGDSLLHGTRPGTAGVQRHAFDDALDFYYETEDKQNLGEYLGHGRYHAVVGNPPYITPKDPVLRDAYRSRFPTCYGGYQLTIPFVERFFDLANEDRGGFVGMIVAIAFAKQRFGRKLVESFLANREITCIVDTSRAHIPEHGTPTVVIFGINRSPRSDVVRVVGGIRAEASAPAVAADGAVWKSILQYADVPGSGNEYVSVQDVDRGIIGGHPWTIAGGGTAELRQLVEEERRALATLLDDVGAGALTREDEVYCIGRSTIRRKRISPEMSKPYVGGETIRDWLVLDADDAIWPYGEHGLDALQAFLWSWRNQLRIRVAFGKTQIERGLKWFEYSMYFANRFRDPLSITFTNLATHNHFALSRGVCVFNSHAPMIKLKTGNSEVDYISLLGALNSSTICFWLKQVCHSKGGGGIGGGLATEPWEQFSEIPGSAIYRIPLPSTMPLELGTQLQALADRRSELTPSKLGARQLPSRLVLDHAREQTKVAQARMIALQEELDWQVYFLYGLTKESLTLPLSEVPEIELGQRAFEIAMARQMAEGELETEWFNRHGSTPVTEIPAHWPETYRQLVQKRLDIIATDRDIALIEQPEYKRRWNLPRWEDLETEALKSWLLDRLEDARYWPTEPPLLRTAANLAAAAGEDIEFMQVAEIYTKRSDFKVEALVSELIEKESIPFLPILRYKPSGLIKRKLWEETWALQRREDAGEKLDIPVPPKYDKSDFATDTGWKLRGKLDVPKERWVSYPHLEGNGDSSLLIGWAGYDYAQQAIAIATYYQAAREDGWSNERLIPILSGIQELLPWVLQWHNQPDATGTGTGDFVAEFLRDQLSHLNLSESDIRAWTPPQKTRAKPAKARSKKSTTVEVTQ